MVVELQSISTAGWPVKSAFNTTPSAILWDGSFLWAECGNSKYFDNSTPITRSSRTFVPVVIEDAFDGDVHLLLDLDLVHLLEV